MQVIELGMITKTYISLHSAYKVAKNLYLTLGETYYCKGDCIVITYKIFCGGGRGKSICTLKSFDLATKQIRDSISIADDCKIS